MYQRFFFIGLVFVAVGFLAVTDAQRTTTTTRSPYKVKDVKLDENYVNITMRLAPPEAGKRSGMPSVMENMTMEMMRRLNVTFRAFKLFPPAYTAFQYPQNTSGYKGLTVNKAYSVGFSLENPPSNATYVTTTTPTPENATTTEAPTTTMPLGAQQFPNSQRNMTDSMMQGMDRQQNMQNGQTQASRGGNSQNGQATQQGQQQGSQETGQQQQQVGNSQNGQGQRQRNGDSNRQSGQQQQGGNDQNQQQGSQKANAQNGQGQPQRGNIQGTQEGIRRPQQGNQRGSAQNGQVGQQQGSQGGNAQNGQTGQPQRVNAQGIQEGIRRPPQVSQGFNTQNGQVIQHHQGINAPNGQGIRGQLGGHGHLHSNQQYPGYHPKIQRLPQNNQGRENYLPPQRNHQNQHSFNTRFIHSQKTQQPIPRAPTPNPGMYRSHVTPVHHNIPFQIKPFSFAPQFGTFTGPPTTFGYHSTTYQIPATNIISSTHSVGGRAFEVTTVRSPASYVYTAHSSNRKLHNIREANYKAADGYHYSNGRGVKFEEGF